MLRPNTVALTALLALLTGIAPLSVDMYLASLPDIGRTLSASDAQVQLTLSFYLDRLCARAGVLWPDVRPARAKADIAGGAFGFHCGEHRVHHRTID